MKFKDVHTATRMRDSMRKIASKEIDRAVPPDVFGHVTEIDEIAMTAKYVLVGSSTEQSAPYGFGDPPAIGQAVRITGRAGSRYVVGMGAAANVDDLISTETPGDVTGVAISDLFPAVTPLTGDELLVIVQDGVTLNVPVSEVGGGGGDSFWQYGVTDTDTLDVEAATQATMEQFFVLVDTAAGLLGLRVNDTQPSGGGAGDYEIGVTLGKFGPLAGASSTPLSGTLDLTSESLTTGAYSEVFLQSGSNTGFVASDQIGANSDYEAYSDQFADNSRAWFEFIAIGPSGDDAEIDIYQQGGLASIDLYANELILKNANAVPTSGNLDPSDLGVWLKGTNSDSSVQFKWKEADASVHGFGIGVLAEISMPETYLAVVPYYDENGNFYGMIRLWGGA